MTWGAWYAKHEPSKLTKKQFDDEIEKRRKTLATGIEKFRDSIAGISKKPKSDESPKTCQTLKYWFGCCWLVQGCQIFGKYFGKCCCGTLDFCFTSCCGHIFAKGPKVVSRIIPGTGDSEHGIPDQEVAQVTTPVVGKYKFRGTFYDSKIGKEINIKFTGINREHIGERTHMNQNLVDMMKTNETIEIIEVGASDSCCGCKKFARIAWDNDYINGNDATIEGRRDEQGNLRDGFEPLEISYDDINYALLLERTARVEPTTE